MRLPQQGEGIAAEHVDALAPDARERITLEVEALLALRHMHVADQHRPSLGSTSKYLGHSLSAIGFWTTFWEKLDLAVQHPALIASLPSNRGLLRRESPLPEPCVGFLLHCYSDPWEEWQG
jgi:hypothetical protein